MMVELARELQDADLVHLGQVAKVTGLSVNYLAQLAMPLKNCGLLRGISGKKGGYQLGKAPEQIRVSEILVAVQGPVGLTDCVNSPELCLNASFCEARMLWAIATHKMLEVFDQYTLADLIDRKWKEEMNEKYKDLWFMNPAGFVEGVSAVPNCPATRD